MARKQKPTWITSKQAAAILTEQSDHTVSDNYVRRLGKLNKVETKRIDLRTKLYSEADIRSYIVKNRTPQAKAGKIPQLVSSPGR